MHATRHQHHFEDFSPDDFERLVYWLVKRSGEFDRVQWYGGARDKGRDVVAYKHTPAGREKWYIQCKRYQSIGFATLRDELDKVAEHAEEEPGFAPDVIVFATACPVPPQAKDQAADRVCVLGLPEPYYWGRLELDERLKAQPEMEEEFFGLPSRPYVPLPLPETDVLPEPGQLPPGSRVPFQRNELFTGREGPLKALAQALVYDGATSTLVTQAVQGMGGIGKTQLAVEFAYRYGRYLHGAHWINAAQAGGIGAEVAACGEAMRLPNWPIEQPEQVARTLSEWQRGGARLVVLDNLEEVEAAREWLRRLGGGSVRVLVTARRGKWPRDLGLGAIRLEVFAPGESRAFLRGYLDEGRAADGDLDRLGERLGHLPLALELAGRYLDVYASLSVSAYLADLENVVVHDSMLDSDEMGSPTDHDLSLEQTFELSWKRVVDPAAQHLFQLAGHCAPNQPIPRDLLRQASDLDGKACDKASYHLISLGLLKETEAGALPSIHPLLAEYARHQETEFAPLPALADALAALASAANERMDQSGSPSHFVPLLPHVRLVAGTAESEAAEDAASLWGNLDYYLSRVADYTGAREAAERALAIDEAVYGPEHPSVATLVNNLGGVLKELGELAEARAAYERALAILENSQLPSDHPYIRSLQRKLEGLR